MGESLSSQGDVEMISELATTLKQLNPNPESTNAAPCAIVYARKRETTERIAQQLTDKVQGLWRPGEILGGVAWVATTWRPSALVQGLGCKAYHAGMKAEKREEVLVGMRKVICFCNSFTLVPWLSIFLLCRSQVQPLRHTPQIGQAAGPRLLLLP